MYSELYKDKQYCYSEILEARKIFGTVPFTYEKGELLLKGLCLMLFHCPEEIKDTVEATIYETSRRMLYALTGI